MGIVGLGSYLPEQVLTNQDLEKLVETTDEWIRSRTGIRERRILPPDMATSDMALEAARRALADAGVEPAQVDCIIVATVTPDTPFPSVSTRLQDRLGAKRAAAFDISAACPGFLYGMTVGSQMVASGLYDTVLVVGAETLSRVTNYQDRNTCVLFGDAAGAAVLRPVAKGKGLLSSVLGSDGSGADLLQMPAGGSRLPASAETVANRQHYLYMNGSEVFKFAVRIMEEASLQALEKAGLTPEDVDFFVPHQANIRIIDSARRRLGVDMNRVVVTLDLLGNTSSASIPVALEKAVKEGRIGEGDVVVAVAFGAGLTWAATVLRWGK
ncbi:MAG: ketoacyl-ACP synthase III [Firmicutes bacterium]|nr:ketoacyl-ACP synthase III [Bacillota bacterium]